MSRRLILFVDHGEKRSFVRNRQGGFLTFFGLIAHSVKHTIFRVGKLLCGNFFPFEAISWTCSIALLSFLLPFLPYVSFLWPNARAVRRPVEPLPARIPSRRHRIRQQQSSIAYNKFGVCVVYALSRNLWRLQNKKDSPWGYKQHHARIGIARSAAAARSQPAMATSRLSGLGRHYIQST